MVTRSRTALSALLAGGLLLVAGCTGSGSTGAPAEGSPGTSAPVPSSAPLIDGPMADATTPATPAEDYEQRVLATGLDAGTALVLAETRSTVEVVDGHTFVIRSEFPTGATGTATYHLYAPTTMSPDDPPEFTGEVVGDEFRYTMAYAVDTTGMPADLQAQIASGLPTSPPAAPAAASTTGSVQLIVLGPRPGHARAADGVPSTLGVVVDGVISQAQESGVDSLLEKAKDRGLPGSGAAGGSWDAFKAGKKVWEALDANDIVAKALAELDALEKCARNPTVPLTKREYKRNPAAQQQVLNTIASARAEIKANAAVLFTSMVTDTASGLVKSAPWLGFIVSPAVNYTKETLLGLIQAELARARQAVVPCRPLAYRISGTIPSVPSGIRVTGQVCRLDREFVAMADGDYVGRFTFSPADELSGDVQFKGRVGNAPLKVTGGGQYTVSLAEDGSAGTIDFPFKSTISIPGGRSTTGSGPVTLSLTEIPPCEKVPGS